MGIVKYKKSYEKIAMGLLSFMITEPKPKKLQEIVQVYEENQDWQLYLWKKNDDFVGIIGIEVSGQTFSVRHIAVDSSFRNERIGSLMVENVQQLHEPLAMCSTIDTRNFLTKCWQRKYSA